MLLLYRKGSEVQASVQRQLLSGRHRTPLGRAHQTSFMSITEEINIRTTNQERHRCTTMTASHLHQFNPRHAPIPKSLSMEHNPLRYTRDSRAIKVQYSRTVFIDF